MFTMLLMDAGLCISRYLLPKFKFQGFKRQLHGEIVTEEKTPGLTLSDSSPGRPAGSTSEASYLAFRPSVFSLSKKQVLMGTIWLYSVQS